MSSGTILLLLFGLGLLFTLYSVVRAVLLIVRSGFSFIRQVVRRYRARVDPECEGIGPNLESPPPTDRLPGRFPPWRFWVILSGVALVVLAIQFSGLIRIPGPIVVPRRPFLPGAPQPAAWRLAPLTHWVGFALTCTFITLWIATRGFRVGVQVQKYEKQGRYQEALAKARRDLDWHRRYLGGLFPMNYVTALNNLATLHHKTGNYAAAEPLLHQALAVLRARRKEKHPVHAMSLNQLAILHKSTGNFAAADSCYRQVLAIRGRMLGEHDPKYADALNNLAALYLAMHNYQAAESLLQRALAIYRAARRERDSNYAIPLVNLAVLHIEQKDFARAEPLLRQVLEIRRAAQGESHIDCAIPLSSLAVLCARTGRLDEAETLYRRVLALRRTALGESHPSYALTLSNLADVHYQRGDWEAAEPLHRQSGETFRAVFGDEHRYCSLNLRNRAAIAVRRGRPGEALALLGQAAAIDDRLAWQVLSIGSESQRLAYLAGIQEGYHWFLSLVARYLPDSPEAARAALDLVLRRKAVTTEALAVQREVVLEGRYPALRPKLEELLALRRQIAQKTLAGPGAEGAAVHRQILAEWQTRKERREAALARQVPELNLQQRLQATDGKAVASVLPPGSALVEIVRYEPFDFEAVTTRGEPRWRPARYLAFVLPAEQADQVKRIDLGEAATIERLVAAFRSGVTGAEDQRAQRDVLMVDDEPVQAADTDDGAALRAAVFDPLAVTLGDRRRLLVAPDGELTRLPFEVLPTADGRRLIDDYQISYLGCGRDALRFGAAPVGQPTPPVLAADPDFDLAHKGPSAGQQEVNGGRRSRDLEGGALHFPRLPGTRREGERVAELLGVRPWLDGDVLAKPLKQVRSPRILHLATHGFFLSDQQRDPGEQQGWVAGEELGRLSGLRLENPLLRSGLALAGANTWLRRAQPPAEAEDGLLTAEDVTGMDLSATELVVLSACETGLGQVHTGEGVFGLRRAFVLAGARTLIMSLWKVADEPTEELMADFYRRLLAGEGRAEALRQAQLALKGHYPDPCFWGAFVCLGDPAPLPALGNPTRPDLPEPISTASPA
jgi:CHAT domain-containing protein/tetratricopeptide (TPR) repeat protein